MPLYTSTTGSFAFRKTNPISNVMEATPVYFDRRNNRCPGQPNEPHLAVKDKQAENDQPMQSNNEEDEFASGEITSEERTQLMAEISNVEEFVKLRKELGYDDAGSYSAVACRN